MLVILLMVLHKVLLSAHSLAKLGILVDELVYVGTLRTSGSTAGLIQHN
jgi:hypothetical protein